jgi:hypothetical protein
MIGGGIVDYAAHERLRMRERLRDNHAIHQRGDFLHQLLFLAVLDDQAAGGGAALAGG